jgi:hypothetical protein
MKQVWPPDELTQHVTLTHAERTFLGFKADAATLSLAVLLKTFQYQGRFLERPSDVPEAVVAFLAQQLRLPDTLWAKVDWSGRTSRRYRDEVMHFCRYRSFRRTDESDFVTYLTPLVVELNADSDVLRQSALAHLRAQRIVPPSAARLRRCLRVAVSEQETHWLKMISSRLPARTRIALDTLISTDINDQGTQQPLLVVRSSLAELKDNAGSVKVTTVLDELQKLKELQSLSLPESLFQDIPPKVVTQYRRRAANEPPRELRRHSETVRYALLAALCWQRQVEVTDNLVELLIHIAHHISARAESRVESELLRQLRKVKGKTTLLFKLAKAARAQPEGAVKEVIYPVVPEGVLDDLIREAEAEGSYDRQVRLVTRNSYGRHYRRVVPLLLEALEFHCNNDLHRPTMRALELLAKYRGHKSVTFPIKEDVPLRAIVNIFVIYNANEIIHKLLTRLHLLDSAACRVAHPAPGGGAGHRTAVAHQGRNDNCHGR